MFGLLFDILVPRFITEPFCLIGNDEEGYDAVCAYKYREEGERFDKIIDISYFNLFGYMCFKNLKQDTVRKFLKEDVL